MMATMNLLETCIAISHSPIGATGVALLIVSADRPRLTDAAKIIGITSSALTGTADRLAKLGLAERAFDSEDRRIIRICITNKGRELLSRLNQ